MEKYSQGNESLKAQGLDDQQHLNRTLEVDPMF